MADSKNISQPSSGSEDLGRVSTDARSTGIPSAGTDTQLHLAAKGGNKNRDKNDDEKVLKNDAGESEFLTSNETDE